MNNYYQKMIYTILHVKKHALLLKWFHYFDIYDKYFSKFRNADVVICEIGVCKGDSMQMWQNYFGKNATIIGIDINEECRKFEI